MISAGGEKIQQVADGVADDDAATVGQIGHFARIAVARVADAGTLPLSPTIPSPGLIEGGSNGSINGSGVDGLTDLAIADVILVQESFTDFKMYRGLYEVTIVGTGGTKYRLTRIAEFPVGDPIVLGTIVTILAGSTYAGAFFQLYASNNATPVIETHQQFWRQST